MKIFNREGNLSSQSNYPKLESQRALWYLKRKELESDNYSSASPGRQRSIKKWFLFSYAIKFFAFFLRKTSLFKIGKVNANNLIINHLEHQFNELPNSFNGLSILHLSDLHLQERPDVVEKIISLAVWLPC